MNFECVDTVNDNIEYVYDKDRTHILISNKSGDGKMIIYNAFEGAFISFNDFHLKECSSKYNPETNILCIEHCREGRIEWDSGSTGFLYIEAGDVLISNNKIGAKNSQYSFPINHYHGVSISFDIEIAAKSIPALMGGFSADIKDIANKYCKTRNFFVLRANKQIEHIFSEIYNMPSSIRLDYCKIKMLELLLFLSTIDIKTEHNASKYFDRQSVMKVKQMVELMSENLQRKYTVAELSQIFCFPLTSMKKCFKGVYGQSIYSYMKSYRMNAAAVMLRNNAMSVTEIAGLVGYDNSGKFAAAFKKVFGRTPSEYKNVSKWIDND